MPPRGTPRRPETGEPYPAPPQRCPTQPGLLYTYLIKPVCPMLLSLGWASGFGWRWGPHNSPQRQRLVGGADVDAGGWWGGGSEASPRLCGAQLGRRLAAFMRSSPHPALEPSCRYPGFRWGGDERLLHRCHLLGFSGPSQEMSCLAAAGRLSPQLLAEGAPKRTGGVQTPRWGRPNRPTLKGLAVIRH